MVLVLLLLGPRSARTSPLPAPIAPDIIDDPRVLLGHLEDGTPKERTYAARELRRQASRAVGDLSSRDPIRASEAKLLLELFDGQLAPTCTEVLSVRYLTGSCADILRTLETTSALPALHALAPDLRGSRARKVSRAIRFLESL